MSVGLTVIAEDDVKGKGNSSFFKSIVMKRNHGVTEAIINMVPPPRHPMLF